VLRRNYQAAPTTVKVRTPRHAPGPIPSTLSDHLCIDFVNSRFSDHTGSGRVFDRLEREEWRLWFVGRSGFVTASPLDARVHAELSDLRDLLRRLLLSGRRPDAGAVAHLNRCLAGASRWWQLAPAGRGMELSVRWSDKGWPAVMAAVAASYAALLVGGGISRVRACANPDCSFIFYDDSRNGSRRWCDVAVCGNLLKVRSHRAGGSRREPRPRSGRSS
jgi:predicted RNA-binding Zn ribbon-like protein